MPGRQFKRNLSLVVALVATFLLPMSTFADSKPVPQSAIREIHGRFYFDNKIEAVKLGVPSKLIVQAVLPRVNAFLNELGFSLSAQSIQDTALPSPDINASLKSIMALETDHPDVFNIGIVGETNNGNFGLAMPSVVCTDANASIVAVFRGLSSTQLETLAITIAHELTHVLGYPGHSAERLNGVANVMFPYSVTAAYGYTDETKEVVAANIAAHKGCFDTFSSTESAQQEQPITLTDSESFAQFDRGTKKFSYTFYAQDSAGDLPQVSCSSNGVGKLSVKIKKAKVRLEKYQPRTRVVSVKVSGRHRKADTLRGVVDCTITSSSGTTAMKAVVF